MKKEIAILASVGILSLGITSVANAKSSEQSLVTQPGIAGPVTNWLSNVYKINSSEKKASATGNWSGGNGFYVSTITWGDGGSNTYQGYGTTQTWTYLYGAQAVYRITLNTSSGGTNATDWLDLNMPNSGY